MNPRGIIFTVCLGVVIAMLCVSFVGKQSKSEKNAPPKFDCGEGYVLRKTDYYSPLYTIKTNNGSFTLIEFDVCFKSGFNLTKKMLEPLYGLTVEHLYKMSDESKLLTLEQAEVEAKANLQKRLDGYEAYRSKVFVISVEVK